MPNRFLLLEDDTGYVNQENSGHIIVDHDVDLLIGDATTLSILMQYQSSGPVALTDGAFQVNVDYTIPTPVGVVFSQQMFAGNNTVQVPVGDPTTCIIVPPLGNTSALILRGSNADTGIPMNLLAPSFLSLDPTADSFVIHVSADVILSLTFI